MKQVLIVGPDPETSMMLKLRLEVEGIQVETAVGKEDALALMKTQFPQLAVIDMINLEKTETQEVEQMLQSLKRKKLRSILLIPRHVKTIDTPRFPSADLTIRKPFDLNRLAKEINQLLNSPRKSSTSRRDSHRRS